MGGVVGGMAGRWAGLTRPQQRLLVACCGGAGFAAVYDVPLGGAFFTAEVLLGSVSLPTMLPALAASWIATLVGWLYLPTGATYPSLPEYRTTASLLVFALVAGPVVGVLAAGYVRLVGWVSTYRAHGVWTVARGGGRVRRARAGRPALPAAVRQRPGSRARARSSDVAAWPCCSPSPC